MLAGDLVSGDQLPPRTQLVAEFGAANPTIQKALSSLKDEGYLGSQPGAGVYVRERHNSSVSATARWP